MKTQNQNDYRSDILELEERKERDLNYDTAPDQRDIFKGLSGEEIENLASQHRPIATGSTYAVQDNIDDGDGEDDDLDDYDLDGEDPDEEETDDDLIDDDLIDDDDLDEDIDPDVFDEPYDIDDDLDAVNQDLDLDDDDDLIEDDFVL